VSEKVGSVDFGSLNEYSMFAKLKREGMMHAEVRNPQAGL
jgi:hypothetical protein